MSLFRLNSPPGPGRGPSSGPGENPPLPSGSTPPPHSSNRAAANVPPSQPPRYLSQTPPPPYYPATHLVAGSLLTESQLVSQFEDFSNHLRYVSDAPGLVFERLVANLNEAFNAAIELERHQHDAALQKCYEENNTLRLSNDKLSEKLSELGETVTGGQVAREVPKSVHQNPAVGEFSATEVRGWDHDHAEICKVVPFTSPYPMPPGIPVGLKSLDIYCGTNPRVKAYTSGIENDHFDIHIDSWGNTILYNAGCTWLEIGANDLDFQFGSYNTLEDTPNQPPKSHNERKITFQRPYSTPPYVVVWLSGFDLGKEAIFRIRTYATNITTTGFTIHIDTWGDSVLNSGIATWVAYPVGKPGVFSGHFSALDLNAEKCSLSYNSGYEMFGRDIFTAPPRILVAIDSLEITNKHNIRFYVKTSDINAIGMKWHLNCWTREGGLYSAGGSYIALS